jgi:hypothetical protein
MTIPSSGPIDLPTIQAEFGGGGSISDDSNPVSGLVSGMSGGSGVVILRYVSSSPDASGTTGSPSLSVSGGYKYYTFTASGTIFW